MKTLTVGELKARFSEVVAELRTGQKFSITYGKKKEKVAVLLPYSLFRTEAKRPLGLLKDRGRCIIHEDFKLNDEQFLSS